MTTQLTTRSSFHAFTDVLQKREPFKTHGALRGQAVPDGKRMLHVGHTGRLPHQYWTSFYQADYAVYSYDTPIAWHYAPLDIWVVPDFRHSDTTARHINKIKTALDTFAEVHHA